MIYQMKSIFQYNNISIPEKLLEEILPRLPVKPLTRFRCIQKSQFTTLLQNPTFIAKHLLLQQTNPNPSLFFKSFDLTLLSLHPPPHLDDDDNYQKVPINLNLKDMGVKKHRFCDMIGCINGIICFGGYLLDGFHGFVLWNPAIKKRKTVCYPLLPDCAACPSSHIIKTL